MTPDPSRVTDFPNFNDISASSREAFSEQAASGIDKVTGIDPSPSNPFTQQGSPLGLTFLMSAGTGAVSL